MCLWHSRVRLSFHFRSNYGWGCWASVKVQKNLRKNPHRIIRVEWTRSRCSEGGARRRIDSTWFRRKKKENFVKKNKTKQNKNKTPTIWGRSPVLWVRGRCLRPCLFSFGNFFADLLSPFERPFCFSFLLLFGFAARAPKRSHREITVIIVGAESETRTKKKKATKNKN